MALSRLRSMTPSTTRIHTRTAAWRSMTVTRIRPESRLGRRWAAVYAAHPQHKVSNDIYRLWPVSRLPDGELLGPHVYLVAAHNGSALYVGQTITSLRERFRTHLRDSRKAAAFAYVASLQFDDTISVYTLGEVERTAQILMAPTMGSAWPRTRR
ncbi:MAG: hypothetical protein EOO27_43085 [Comamonadaceae bacterium]|nr:MAG: hypothetical protein EOO27_43085 [Comamonadaceae bacterium]